MVFWGKRVRSGMDVGSNGDDGGCGVASGGEITWDAGSCAGGQNEGGVG